MRTDLRAVKDPLSTQTKIVVLIDAGHRVDLRCDPRSDIDSDRTPKAATTYKLQNLGLYLVDDSLDARDLGMVLTA